LFFLKNYVIIKERKTKKEIIFMKKEIRFINSNYNPETGISTVTIETDIGRFTATSTLAEEDKETASNFQGCKYAEIKAVRKYVKALLKLKKVEIKTIKNLIDAFDASDRIEEGSRPCAILYRAYYKAINEAKDLESKIEKLGDNLVQKISARDGILKRISEARAKANNQ
jgi:hypothetical protein